MPFYDTGPVKFDVNAKTLGEVNLAINKLHLIIGLMAAKLTPELQEHLIQEMISFNLKNEAEGLKQVLPK